jgi:16S rRNA (guanine527-N7)-methyltransferase
VEKLNSLNHLYTEWNEKINLISRKDLPHLYERHILHSMSIARFFTFPSNSEIMDIGTGGGFPGIPLAILFPESKFLLVDSIGKKIKAVQTIISELKLDNCQAKQQRAEKVSQKFNFIVSRAVSRFDTFASMFKSKISPVQKSKTQNGIIYLKGGDFDEELIKFRENTRIFNISDIYEEEFFETKKIIYLKVDGKYSQSRSRKRRTGR